MKPTEEKAIATFRSGLNCAQAVLTAYSDEMQFDNSLALRIACGFGGGMGRLQEKCGAVTGSFMVLGIHICGKYSDNKERKEKTYAMVKEFNRRFKEIYNSADCIDLLKCDLNTNEGQQHVRDNNLHEVVCEKCIKDSIKILRDIMH
jgi:C_GCAxxG_C_C family probable redox protein